MSPGAGRFRGSGGAVRSVAAFLAVALTLAGCGDTRSSSPPGGDYTGGTRGTSRSPDAPPADVVVTRDGDRLPDGCGPRQTAGLIAGFFRAFNAGDGPELRRAFAAEGASPPLYGVGTGGGGGFGTTRREELLRYFAERHNQGELLRLLQVEARPSGREGAADVANLLVRGANDLRPAPVSATKLESGGYLQTDFHEKALSVKADVAATAPGCVLSARHPAAALPFALSSIALSGPGA